MNDVAKKEAMRRRKRNLHEMRMFKLTISGEIINHWNYRLLLGLLINAGVVMMVVSKGGRRVMIIFMLLLLFLFAFLEMKVLASSGQCHRHC